MHIIIGIIVVLFVGSLIITLLKELLPILLKLAGIVIVIAIIVAIAKAIGLWNIAKFLLGALAVFVVFCIFCAVTSNHSEQRLDEYLESHCKEQGCMSPDRWRKLLPQYVSQLGEERFDAITKEFAKKCEQRYLSTSDRSWFSPAERMIKEKGIVSFYELIYNTKYPAFKYTHVTDNVTLVVRMIEKSEEDSNCIFEKKFVASEEQFRNQMVNLKNVELTERLRTHYGLKDKYSSMSEKKIERIELSLDDLDI
ncbi:MAG: hypothetical protein J6K17_09305 [Oscillospiraceae bacterium]|nr:hypothetical protein [Oscillospiraceae bacterium]